MSKKSSIKYNGDTYIVKSQYDYDLYAIKLNKDKEIERLSKEVTKYDEILGERNNEVDRLYNIINELEKYIGQEYYCFDNESVEFEVAKNILDKLKALKEGKE